jgi:hypothetical protein
LPLQRARRRAISLFIPARVAVGRILAMAAPFVGGWIALQRMAVLAP